MKKAHQTTDPHSKKQIGEKRRKEMFHSSSTSPGCSHASPFEVDVTEVRERAISEQGQGITTAMKTVYWLAK